jgi:hypothetical protein
MSGDTVRGGLNQPWEARLSAPGDPGNAAGGIDFGLRPRIFSGFLTGEVPFQGALPFICLQATISVGARHDRCSPLNGATQGR